MAGESINQAELARVAALGQGKNDGKDPAGEDNAMMELLIGAANNVAGSAARLTGVSPLSAVASSLNTGADAGLKSDGLAGKTIMPAMSHGADTFLGKLARALIKGGFTSFKDLTEGVGGGAAVEPMQVADVSWARLGEITPIQTPNMPVSEIGLGSGAPGLG